MPPTASEPMGENEVASRQRSKVPLVDDSIDEDKYPEGIGQREAMKYVRVPFFFFVTFRPKDPGPNSLWFDGPGFDSLQLTGCLRIK